MAANRQRLALAYDAAAVGVNVGLNLALIPRFGYMGAATSALATACFITICGSVAVSRMLQIGLAPSRMSRLLAANALLAVALWLLTALAAPWWVAVVAAALVYPPFLLLTGVTNLGELKLFLPRRLPPAVPAVRAS
jgi:O-antigen/teichoic acid export membrane protein